MAYSKKNLGCDMRGMLSFHVLFLLSKKPMHGEEIAQEIEKRRGSKPKAGTIYPALKGLQDQGLISGEKDGKVITYHLTKKGRESVANAMDYFYKCFGEIFENCKDRQC